MKITQINFGKDKIKNENGSREGIGYGLGVNGEGGTRTHGDQGRRIYSPLQLPLCDLPGKYLPPKGIEPSTIRLQVGRSTN